MSTNTKDLTEYTNTRNINITKYIRDTRQKYSEKIQIIKCKYCGHDFATIKKNGRPIEYCCEECRQYAREEQSRVKAYRWYHKNKHRLTEKQRWGLGSGTLSQHRQTDFQKEQKIIEKEMARLRLKTRK